MRWVAASGTRRRRRLRPWKMLAAVAFFSACLATAEAVTLKVVAHSDLKILDPIWTGAYITRNHGYMIYDTLFAIDGDGEIKPQMVDTYQRTADGLAYVFTLRDGLVWHDGAPVTAQDCVASIRRWAARDSLGQKVISFVQSITVQDEKTFTIRLNEPTGLLLFALAKPSSNVPFMMPKRVADTDPHAQISDFTGSGPFVFKRDEWRPGEKVVYVRFDKYKARPEPPSALAGGKIAKVDRVEWLAISDQQQAVNALLAGEVDFVESVPHDLVPLVQTASNVTLIDWNLAGNQYGFRPNHLHKPFSDPRIRQALWHAFNQKSFLEAAVGNPAYYRICKSMFPCGTALASEDGMAGLLDSDFHKARALLKEAGYDGTPVVLLHSSDVQVLANLAPVAKSLMEQAGLKVDMQTMDWQTLLSRLRRKEAPEAGGWSAFLTSWSSIDLLNPVMNGFLNAGCEQAMVGWPCDPEIEALRDRYAREIDPARQKDIAAAVQRRNTLATTYIPLGQWYNLSAARTNVTGLVRSPVAVFWNIEKQTSP
jgi:peptide/nickel transport system substrate-binding protein